MWIHGKSEGNGYLPRFLYLYRVNYLGRGAQSGIWGNRPYWVIFKCIIFKCIKVYLAKMVLIVSNF